MLNNIFNTIKKKSLKERFLLVLGILFFLGYLVLGLLFIFMKNLPFAIQPNYRVAFGSLLIVYAAIRFFRIISDK